MKRRFACLLSLALCLSLAPAALAARTFSDVPANHWAYSYVSTAVQKNWVNGMTATQYQPEGRVTGAQFLTMVVRAFYPGDISASSGGAWYQPYVVAADRHSLRAGAYISSDEDLTSDLTRYQMAQVMDNLLADTGRRPTEYFDAAGSIPDWDVVPTFYEQAVAETYALGLLTGVDAQGSFRGYQTMTRAQAAAVLCRLSEAVPVQSPGSDPISAADMVSDQALLAQANAVLLDQFNFLYGLRAGALFDQAWQPSFTWARPGDEPVHWFLVTAPGVNTLADVQRVWRTQFAAASSAPAEYLVNYMERNGRLYTCNEGIGDDISFRSIRAERILSRSGNNASLQVVAYYDDWAGGYRTETYRCPMVWENGRWISCGLLPA